MIIQRSNAALPQARGDGRILHLATTQPDESGVLPAVSRVRPRLRVEPGTGTGTGTGSSTSTSSRQRRPLDPEMTGRLLRGREEGARAGKHQSGTTPYGYFRDYAPRPKDVKGIPLRIHPEEAPIVRAIFEDYSALRSMKRVIERLNARGARTRRGKLWSRAGISWILKNETYLGRVHFGRIRARGEHEAIVDPALYRKIQRIIRRNDKRASRFTAPARA